PPECVVVSPDTGGVKRADMYARLLGLPIAILHKRRANANEVEMAAVIGDIRGKCPIIVDDMISTGVTIRKAVDTLVCESGRRVVGGWATPAVLAAAAPRLLQHPALVEILVTDTIPIPAHVRAALPQLRVVSVAGLLADAIQRLHNGLSLSALFTREGAPP